MYPVYSEGAPIVAETKRPPRVGDDVVVYLRPTGEDDDGSRARAVLIKRLVRRGHKEVELEQFNPPISFRIPAEDILRIDRIMTLDDLLN
jgi:phage repressor protein C with HTH and peptisase S24 domain